MIGHTTRPQWGPFKRFKQNNLRYCCRLKGFAKLSELSPSYQANQHVWFVKEASAIFVLIVCIFTGKLTYFNNILGKVSLCTDCLHLTGKHNF